MKTRHIAVLAAILGLTACATPAENERLARLGSIAVA